MENYKNESMVDVAYSVLKNINGRVSFKVLYDNVCDLLGMSAEEKNKNISKFYTNFSLDGRFVNTGHNEWNLRENEKYEKDTKYNMSYVYSEMEEEEKENKDKDDLDDNELNSDDDGSDEEYVQNNKNLDD